MDQEEKFLSDPFVYRCVNSETVNKIKLVYIHVYYWKYTSWTQEYEASGTNKETDCGLGN